MAGIYVHIPFCKQLCYYCDFHFSLSLKGVEPMIEALCREMLLRHENWKQETFRSLYFGGGTPSVLSSAQLKRLIDTLAELVDLSTIEEQTIEVNPDDLTPAYLHELRALGFNRLSMGVQSFHDHELKLMNRRHDAASAIRAVAMAKEAGFRNITVDVIYGLPNSTLGSLRHTLEGMLALDVPHLSCYHLTFEERTAFSKMKEKRQLSEIDEEGSVQQYELVCTTLAQAGYEHYEISNFARGGLYSQHNLAYWNANPYWGIGPSAHSYDGTNRYYNLSHNRKYTEAVLGGNEYGEAEFLTADNRYNEFLLLSLRRNTGISLSVFSTFEARYQQHFFDTLAHLDPSDFVRSESSIALSESGMFRMDHLLSSLFI